MAESRRKNRAVAPRPATSPYERRYGSRVWTRAEFAGIAYSDGGDAEEALLSLLKKARDVSSGSEELSAEIDGWPREAHLSPARSNLLRPLKFTASQRALELGAGCGALTRYLGEQGVQVDAVEGNLLRAECAAERCRDLPGVRVFADDITAFQAEHRYDVVTLIGVLEYSRVFIDAPDAVRACLEMARGHLAPGGVLVVAIENQLGLKYFNGCAEDHLGTPYSGITDLYSAKSAVTFGRAELQAKLALAGFERADWSFPFPDYKLPTTIISPRGLTDPEFAAGDLLLGEFARDYGGSLLRSFDESAAWSVLSRNGLLGELANSFLVVASPTQANPLDDGAWLAYRFSPQRLKPFSTSTRFSRERGGRIAVTKVVVDSSGGQAPVGVDGDFRVEQRTGVQPYLQGRLLARDFVDAVGRGYAGTELAQTLKPWIDFLAARCTASGAPDVATMRLPGEYLDCIPTNLIVDSAGAVHPIDLEFAVPGEIPLLWVVLRGTIHTATKCFGHRVIATTSFRDFLGEMLAALGFGGIEDWSPYYELEDSLIRAVLRPWKARPGRDILRGRVELPIATLRSLPESHARLTQVTTVASPQELAQLQGHREAVNELISWIEMLPDPRTAAPDPDETRAVPQEVLDAADRVALGLERATGHNFQGQLRELATQRARWAWLARDNLRLAWELNDLQGQLDGERLDGLRTASPVRDVAAGSQEMKAESFGLRIENNALKFELDEKRSQLEASRAELDARAQALADAAGRESELAHVAAQLRSELAAREEALKESAHREREAARAQGREEARAETLKTELLALRGERAALQQDATLIRSQLARALDHSRKRAAELARAQKHLRELSTGASRSGRTLSTSAAPAPVRIIGTKVRSARQALNRFRARTADKTLEARVAALRAVGLFDPDWYARRYPDAIEMFGDGIWHYLAIGANEGCDPSALFHEAWYRRRNGSAMLPQESGLEHFMREGAAADLQPNPLFEPAWYRHTHPDTHGHGPGAFHHFVQHGAFEGRDPHPLFDTAWYLDQYADARDAMDGMSPLAYFLECGALTAHSPCELFDAEFYLSQNPDVEATAINPLIHYLEHGAREGRDPSPEFETNWYLENNPDVAATGANPLVHYRLAGRSEGRLPTRRRTTMASANAVSSAAPPVIDGIREWEDYAPLKERVAAQESLALAQVVVEPPPLASIGDDEIDAVIARLSFPAHEAPKASIVIPVFNKLALTLECLQSLADAGAQAPFEVIVSDDGSSDRSADRLAAIPGLVIHRNAQNLGFLRNCNSAFPLARGEFIVLMNNDVQVTPGWLEALLGTFDAFERVGAVGPKIVYPSGRLQEAGVALRTDGSVEMVGLNDDPSKDRYNYARPVDYASGACLVVKTALLRELGGFSEDFLPCYCEDSDLCMRIRQRGLRIFYQPAATVVHHLSRTTADGSSEVKVRSIAGSLDRFVQKWQEDLDRLSAVRLLAFYLPQFHPIPENDHWWGAGFTEWSNVARAQPNFVGHYQPRLPADLGFYDLRVPEVMDAQAALARRYGIHGFCFYYYWFAGKRLLEGPVERMLATGRPDIPYCLCWANENWTRRWDGEDHEILVAQQHSPEDDEAVIRDLMRHFRSGNYIRIDGKPLLLIYRVGMFPDFRATADRWRQACRREGVGEIYLAMVESFEMVHAGARPEDYNCDASVEFPPLGMAQPRPPSGAIINPEFAGRVADYRDIAARFCARPMPRFTRFRGVMPGWDNTPRRQDNSFCFENSTPGAFQAWLETAIAQTRSQHHGDERLVFVNAWNEWAEGAYLEPDKRYGHGFLEAVRNAQDAEALLRMNRYALDI